MAGNDEEPASEKAKAQERWRCELEVNYPELFAKDVEIYPSYTNFRLKYDLICERRYMQNKKLIRKQFAKELRSMELSQTRAFDGVKVHRIFSKGIHHPKLKGDVMTAKERLYLNTLLSERV